MTVQRLRAAFETGEQLKAHEDKWGRHGSAPPGWRPIDSARFASIMHGYSPEYVENRQIHPAPGEPGVSISATMFYFWNNQGVAVTQESVPFVNERGYKDHHWEARFYMFGCDHAYRPMTPGERKDRGIRLGNCEHADICSKCGDEFLYDSSD